MAGFAALAGFPTWNGSSPAVVWFLLILSPAAAGAVTGVLVQAPAIGQHSNLLRGTIAGIACAVLSLPLMILGFVLLADLFTLGRVPDNFTGPFLGTLFISIFVMKNMWWSILAMGAVGGLTLQLAWGRVNRCWGWEAESSAS
jgi:hypothetical protein